LHLDTYDLQKRKVSQFAGTDRETHAHTPIIEKLKVASFEERMGGHIRAIGELSGEILTDQVNDLFARPKRAPRMKSTRMVISLLPASK
jgi:hypothetical protein